MKIIIEREVLQGILDELTYNHIDGISKSSKIIRKLLKDHPPKTDGVIGVEIDEWPEYAPEDYENINRKMIVNILYMLSAIHYEIDYKEMRAMAQKLLLQLAEQPHD